MKKSHDLFDTTNPKVFDHETCILDYLNPILMDMDPDQGIEAEYRHKKNQPFAWKYLKEVSNFDLVNFHGKPEEIAKFHKYEGDIEKQSEILHERNKKREINMSVPMDIDEDFASLP